MDSRLTKAMMMFLQGPCNGAAIIVNEDEAEIHLYDYDTPNSKSLFEERRTETLGNPVIIMSLREVAADGVIYLKKPIKLIDFLRILEETKKTLTSISSSKQPGHKFANKTRINAIQTDVNSSGQKADPHGEQVDDDSLAQAGDSEKHELKTYYYDRIEQNKISKHQTAMRLDEKNFNKFFGNLENIDLNDPKSIAKAYYNPKDYFQGFVQEAYRVCQVKKQILTLELGWESITLFPHSQEVWFDASDVELRSFADLVINHESVKSKIKLTPVDAAKISHKFTFDKFQSMDSFLWKLACWTSKGHYPKTIDYLQPVYIKRWPNFTRLLITPHALRITSLLSQGPRTMESIARALDINLQYVFVYISATYALGLVDQARRAVDSLIEPPDLKRGNNYGLLDRIIAKLRET